MSLFYDLKYFAVGCWIASDTSLILNFFSLNVQVYNYSVPAQTAPCLVSVIDGFNFNLLQSSGDMLRFLFLPPLFLLKRVNYVPP